MKQMLTVSGGVLFAIAIMSAILGGFTFTEISKFESDLEKRGQVNKVLSAVTGLDELNKQELKKKQDAMSGCFTIAGVTGAIGVGLALAGRTKPNQS